MKIVSSFVKCFNTSFFLLLIFLSSCSEKDIPVTPPTPTLPLPPVWDINAMRGVWVTTTASTALDSRNNIKGMVANCKVSGINNIFVVVYNNARTTYPSTVMTNLIGVPILERFSGRDPLR